MNMRRTKETVNLSAWALKNQQMVSFFMLLVMAMGVFCYERLPRNEDPAFTIKTAVVSAQWPGASEADTTRLLTDTLEKKLQEVPWLDYIESETRAGRTVIHVNLRDDTPPQTVPDIWYQVRKKMQDIAPSLPEGAQGPDVNDEFDDTFGTIYGFIPEGYTLREVRDRVETLRRELMSLPDIGKTTLLGEQQEQMVLAFSPARLAGMGLDIQQVAEALRAQNAVVPAGIIRTGQENIALHVSGALTSEESLRAVTLHINNRYLPLTDIATLTRENAEPPSPAFRVNGKPAIGLAISMAPTGNMLRFGAALNQRVVTLSAGLPHGIEMVKVADQSAVVSDAVRGFIRVLTEAVVIVLAVSFVSLGLRAGLVVAAAILLMGYELVRDSIGKIMHPEETEFTLLVAVILIASILVKLYMAYYNRAIGKKLDSAAMKAVATDSLSDTAATTVVLLASVFTHFTGIKIDGYCGLVVGLLVGYAGFDAARETLNPLLGQPPAHEFVEKIDEIVMSHSEVCGMHDLIVHDYGPGRQMISLHAEVPAEGNILELHDVIDNIENELRETLGCEATIHMDPVVTSDEHVSETKAAMVSLIKAIDEDLSIHDFRMVSGGTHTNLIFDILAPFGFRLTDEELLTEVLQSVHEHFGDNYYVVTKIDHSYI